MPNNLLADMLQRARPDPIRARDRP
ncbi:uncharacterized protein METZ01_LOCUS145994, partial [marine metagenome]